MGVRLDFLQALETGECFFEAKGDESLQRVELDFAIRNIFDNPPSENGVTYGN